MAHTGPVIRETRKALKMSLRELADASGVTYSTISRIEREEYDPPARTIKALTDALGAALGQRGAA
jgi:transcriptional regulator with XRE-family HTH domain